MSDQKKKNLFSEFPPVTTKQWEEKIYEDLKGSDYNKKLVWQTLEGFSIQPYYRREDLKDKSYLDVLPGEYPFTRGNFTRSNEWEIRQEIKLDDTEEANQKSLFILERGINSLGFICPTYSKHPPLVKQEDISRLLRNIPFDCISLHFVCAHQGPQILDMLIKEVEIRKFEKSLIRGSIDYDPLGYLTITGNYGTSEKSDFEALHRLMHLTESKLPNYRVLGINGYFLQHAGSSVVQELGYSLAMASEYLTKLTDSGISADMVSRYMQFNFGVGSNYFMEIAKIRAARTLWAKVIEAYNPKESESKQTHIHSITSEWNQTIYDPYVNVLRATTESMAAVIGGTNSLTVRPFTWPYKSTNRFSGRVARNIQLILNEEAYLNKIIDPAAGSYYLENLTDSIINEAWKLFLSIEEEGGYTEALKKGIIQSEIEKTSLTRNLHIATRKDTLVGINQYPNTDEIMKDEIEEGIVFSMPQSDTGMIKPLKIYRGATEFEKLRLATEKHAFRPKVFLLTYGDISMRRARASFSANFFGCAGYQIFNNPGFDTVKKGVKAALESHSHIVVICSSDEEYPTLAPQVNEYIKDKALIVVAGAPLCMEDLKTKGIKYFIHLKSNVLETLQMFHQKLGIVP